MELQDLLRMLVDHVGDGDGGDNLEQIGRKASEQPTNAFTLNCLACHVHDAGVGPRV